MNPELLSDLHRDLGKLQAEVTALRAAVPAKRAPRSRPRRFLTALLAAMFLMTMPLGLFAANFQDLNPGSPHNADINLIADAGISVGCGDAQHYCPNAYVTREQMASFLARTAGLGNHAPVTNAATLNGYGANDLLRVAGAEQGQSVSSNGTTWKTATEVTLTAPGPGYVQVNGSIIASLTGGTAGTLYVRLYDAASGQEAVLYPTVKDGTTLTFAPTRVFEVGSAGSRTYQLQIRSGGPSWTILGYQGQITALFVPFGAAGNTP